MMVSPSALQEIPWPWIWEAQQGKEGSVLCALSSKMGAPRALTGGGQSPMHGTPYEQPSPRSHPEAETWGCSINACQHRRDRILSSPSEGCAELEPKMPPKLKNPQQGDRRPPRRVRHQSVRISIPAPAKRRITRTRPCVPIAPYHPNTRDHHAPIPPLSDGSRSGDTSQQGSSPCPASTWHTGRLQGEERCCVASRRRGGGPWSEEMDRFNLLRNGPEMRAVKGAQPDKKWYVSKLRPSAPRREHLAVLKLKAQPRSAPLPRIQTVCFSHFALFIFLGPILPCRSFPCPCGHPVGPPWGCHIVVAKEEERCH